MVKSYDPDKRIEIVLRAIKGEKIYENPKKVKK